MTIFNSYGSLTITMENPEKWKSDKNPVWLIVVAPNNKW